MANVWNTKGFYQNTTRPTTADWESVCVTQRQSGTSYIQDILVNIPAGLSNTAPDRIILYEAPGSIFTGAAGLRVKRLYLANTTHVAGTMTFSLGWVMTAATAYGTALTTLQSATTLDVAIATLEAAVDITAPDRLALTLSAAGPTTTASVLTGFIEFYCNRPV